MIHNMQFLSPDIFI